MKNLYKKFGIALAFLGVLTVASCESSSSYEDELPSIANIAVSNDAFSTLEAAAVNGGVAGVLSNSNPNDPSGDYTVFAPNNSAFARLGLTESTLGALQTSFLTNTLLYHVSNGNLAGSAIQANGTSGSALGGLTRRFINRDGTLYINGSKILATDIAAANGTVHVIDKVMIATGGNVVASAIALQTAAVFKTPELRYLVQAVVYAGLADALSNPDAKFTVFAPNDQAFINLGTALGLSFNKPEDVKMIDKDLLTAVLLNHVFADTSKDRFTSELNAGIYETLGSDTIKLGAYNNGVLTVSGSGNAQPANMVIPDVQTTNGIVHVIDQVLLP
ncbi:MULTISPECIES: fasciclin domain-containing protein [unclassified Polaribacter]|uniref:fasciclin domain-containing protein n=1 Tax=unclassified Polaribacter TaxID=196858 RepID=UPI0011BDB116|nr:MULTISPECIES: fasciclin domain-containing protein [unclassified Polaribacter]TXD50330.1 fasciclin domain-containing protein [Polaribacter sp. IC063]TXD56402.1 fasciclin domain-containing protein [Polaribacter sp. IC066]